MRNGKVISIALVPVLHKFTVDSLYNYFLYKQTHDVSNKFLGPTVLFPVQVSFTISTPPLCMTLDISTATEFWSLGRAYDKAESIVDVYKYIIYNSRLLQNK